MAIGVYRIDGDKLHRVAPDVFKKEKDLQRLLEKNLQTVFGIRFLETEYSTGDRHGGRMDTIGIDDTNAPVIIEYKRTENQNVINQALFYLDWLMDHRGDFELLVLKRLGAGVKVDWSSPRVLCVAPDFNKYDKYAVMQMGRPIELIQYRLFEGGILMLDVVATGESASKATPRTGGSNLASGKAAGELANHNGETTAQYSVDDHIQGMPPKTVELFNELREYILSLGEDVSESPRKMYIAYRVLRNFVCVEIHKQHLLAYISLDPSLPPFQTKPFRDVRKIGHWGTGDLEARIETAEDLELAKSAIEAAYKNHAG